MNVGQGGVRRLFVLVEDLRRPGVEIEAGLHRNVRAVKYESLRRVGGEVLQNPWKLVRGISRKIQTGWRV